IVFSSDRGLCGTFNSGLNRFLTGKLRRKEIPHPELFLVGQKGYDWFKRMGYPIRDHILHKKPVDLPDAVKQAIHQATDDFLEKKYARVYMAYNTFYNPLRQEPTLIQLLPVVSDVQEAEKPNPAHGHTEEPAMTSSFLYEPSQEEILSHLLPQYLENQAFTALLNTFAGEHGSRMVAMEGATKNAGEMIHKLTLQYNRMRQAVITRELIEIINGAQSL
ncbi:MAG: F0F1 ATP synthase subunit gamma, partial [Deltaproteobacteria bacterium]|nr:F0F1 ATP synthase subunit gamma [Deltaproteobacteria bacterium]